MLTQFKELATVALVKMFLQLNFNLNALLSKLSKDVHVQDLVMMCHAIAPMIYLRSLSETLFITLITVSVPSMITKPVIVVFHSQLSLSKCSQTASLHQKDNHVIAQM